MTLALTPTPTPTPVSPTSPKRLDLAAAGHGSGSRFCAQINIGTQRQRDRVSGALNSTLANISADARSADRDIDFALHVRASRAAGGEDADERGTRTTTRKKRSRS
jgi:hypothetical protein